MNKKDLKTGMRVEFRNGSVNLVLKDIANRYTGHEDIAFVNFKNFMGGNSYREDLTRDSEGESEYDIVKVYGIDREDDGYFLRGNVLKLNQKYLIWERAKPKEMTIKEIEKELGYKIKIMDKK